MADDAVPGVSPALSTAAFHPSDASGPAVTAFAFARGLLSGFVCSFMFHPVTPYTRVPLILASAHVCGRAMRSYQRLFGIAALLCSADIDETLAFVHQWLSIVWAERYISAPGGPNVVGKLYIVDVHTGHRLEPCCFSILF
jgi:hypothetical protein